MSSRHQATFSHFHPLVKIPDASVNFGISPLVARTEMPHMTMKTKTKLILSGLIAASLTAPAFGQIGIYIGQAPPPMRYETRPPMPGNGYVWIDGYWGVRGNRYVWNSGRWDRPPYPGAYYS